MMYRCQGCKCIVRPGQPLKKHVRFREVPVTKVVAGEIHESTRKEVESEINVCDSCLTKLEAGTPLSVLYGAPQAPPIPEPEEEAVPLEEQAPPARVVLPTVKKPTTKPKNPIKKVVPNDKTNGRRRK